jgi:RNA polymerase sigma-70 factor (ECF subfamily)
VVAPFLSPASTERRDAADADSEEESRVTRTPAQDRRIAMALAQHFESVWRALRRFGVPQGSADDAAQQVFVSFAQRIDVVELGRERPYLMGIAARVAANARRQQARSREEPTEQLDEAASSSRDPEALLVHEQRRRKLDEALGTMPELQRQVFVLYELEGFSLPEIAGALGVPLGTAASRLRRAREAFEAWISEHLPLRGEP